MIATDERRRPLPRNRSYDFGSCICWKCGGEIARGKSRLILVHEGIAHLHPECDWRLLEKKGRRS